MNRKLFLSFAQICMLIEFCVMIKSFLFMELNVNELNGQEAEVWWRDPDPNCKTGYILKYQIDGNKTLKEVNISIGDPMPVRIDGLVPGYLHPVHLYSKRQCQVNDEEVIKYEKTRHFTTRPNPPSSLSCRVDSDNRLVLYWDRPKEPCYFRGYSIKVNDDKNSTFYVEKSNFSFSTDDLIPGKPYEFSVRSDSAQIKYPNHLSDEAYIQCRNHPLPPFNLTSSNITPRNFTIDWNHPFLSTYFDSYIVFINGSIKDEIPRSSQSYILNKEIHPGHLYKIAIASLSGISQSSKVKIDVRTPPSAPLNVTYSMINQTLLLDWDVDTDSHQDHFNVTIYDGTNRKLKSYQRISMSHLLLNDTDINDDLFIAISSFSNNVQSEVVYLNNRDNNSLSSIKKDEFLGNVTIENEEEEMKWSLGQFSPSLFIIAFLVTMGVFTVIGLIYFRSVRHEITMMRESIHLNPLCEDNEDEKEALVERDKLLILREIGSGQFGRVYHAKLTINNKVIDVALKMLNSDNGKKSTDKEEIMREALIMKNFCDDHVLQLIGVTFEDNGSPIVILPYMANGSLLSHLKNDQVELNVYQLLKFALDVAKGMEYLSVKGFIHRDLAARNCLLDDSMSVKVADFGLTKEILDKTYYRSHGNSLIPIRWLAIETLEDNVYTIKTDVWSYGVLLWELMTRGDTPYHQLNRFEQIVNYLRCGNRLPKPSYSPNIVHEISTKCWTEDPDLRPDFSEIRSKLKIITQYIHKNMGPLTR